jgi:hypothetical protein
MTTSSSTRMIVSPARSPVAAAIALQAATDRCGVRIGPFSPRWRLSFADIALTASIWGRPRGRFRGPLEHRLLAGTDGPMLRNVYLGRA